MQFCRLYFSALGSPFLLMSGFFVKTMFYVLKNIASFQSSSVKVLLWYQVYDNRLFGFRYLWDKNEIPFSTRFSTIFSTILSTVYSKISKISILVPFWTTIDPKVILRKTPGTPSSFQKKIELSIADAFRNIHFLPYFY